MDDHVNNAGIRYSVKHFLLRHLPVSWEFNLKKIYYPRMIRRMAADYEPEVEVVTNLVSPGDRVVDIGANVGIYTRFLSEAVGPEGSVLSIEPIAQTFALLASNVRKLKLGNVECRNGAVSSMTGNVEMEVPDWQGGGKNYYMAKIAPTTNGSGTTARQEVAAYRLDDLVPDPAAVSFIKCDVEGHEMECLRGAPAVLARSAPAWLIEVSDGGGDDPDDNVFNFMHTAGYRCYWYDPRERRLQRNRRGHVVNYLFLRDSHCERLQSRGFTIA